MLKSRLCNFFCIDSFEVKPPDKIYFHYQYRLPLNLYNTIRNTLNRKNFNLFSDANSNIGIINNE